MVEAGLGGRHDATNVLGAPVVVLTNVGLEHTRWLGPTVRDIAREKLAVVRAGRHAGAGAARPRGARRTRVATGARIVAPEPLEAAAALPGYQAHELRGRRGRRARAARRARPAAASPRSPARVQVPGRMQVGRRAAR